MEPGKWLFSQTIFYGGSQVYRSLRGRDSGHLLRTDFLCSGLHPTVEMLGALCKALLELEKGPGYGLSPLFLTDGGEVMHPIMWQPVAELGLSRCTGSKPVSLLLHCRCIRTFRLGPHGVPGLGEHK